MCDLEKQTDNRINFLECSPMSEATIIIARLLALKRDSFSPQRTSRVNTHFVGNSFRVSCLSMFIYSRIAVEYNQGN